MTERVKRKISAIMSADAVGYSALMEADEESTARTMESYRKTVTSLIEQHDGKVIDSPGDNVLSEFGSVVDAVQCAVEIQHIIKAKNAGLTEARRMEFRIGINLGDIIKEEGRVYGDGVNIASRIEGLANGGGICISGSAYDQIKSKLALGYESLGEHSVKNISEPVRVYRIPMETSGATGIGLKSAGERKWRNIALAAIAAVVVGAGLIVAWNFIGKPSPSEETSKTEMPPSYGEPTIAVLPFANISDDPKQEYFADGVTDEIIDRLSSSWGVAVISRNSTFFYKGKPINIKQIGAELGARYVLEGSIRKSENRIRVTAQLIESSTDRHIWSKTFDREMKEIFALQDEIAQEIVISMRSEGIFVAEKARIDRTPTENFTAYDAVLKSQYAWNESSKEGYLKAKDFAEKAIELDPLYADAYDILSFIILWGNFSGWNPDPNAYDQAENLARKAISLNSSNSMSYATLAHVLCYSKQQCNQAVVQAERAVSLNPNSVNALTTLGSVLGYAGRPEKAIPHIKKAMKLNPHYAHNYNIILADAYIPLGRYEEVIKLMKEVRARNPSAIWLYYHLTRAYRMSGQYDNAIEAAKEALIKNPDWEWPHHELIWSYLESWEAQQNKDPDILDQAIEIAKRRVAVNEENATNYMALSLTYRLKKQFEQALIAAERTVAIDPKNTDLKAWLAVTLNSVGRYEDAIKLAENALKQNPQLTIALRVLGMAYRLTGKHVEAEEMLKRALNLSYPHYDRYVTHISLAALFGHLNQIERAKIHAAEILKFAPNFSVDVWGERVPYKDPALAQKDMAALRKAGLK